MVQLVHMNTPGQDYRNREGTHRPGVLQGLLLKTGVAVSMAAVSVHCLAAAGAVNSSGSEAAASGNAEPGLVRVQVSNPDLLTIAVSPLRFADAAHGVALMAMAPAVKSASRVDMPEDASDDAAVSSSAARTDALPEDPGALGQDQPLKASVRPEPPTPGRAAGPVAPRLTKYIPAGWTAQPITGRDKFLIGVRDLYSPLNFVAMVVSAGYEQALNGQPNYGTDKGAFGERLGAAAIRESTQGFFTDSVFSPLLHQDPRYYIEGSQYNFFHRVIYAGTRPLITRTDSGRNTINASLLLGYAASSALTYAYYPQINRDPHDVAATFGGAIGGAALGFVVSEFADDVLQAVHLEKKR